MFFKKSKKTVSNVFIEGLECRQFLSADPSVIEVPMAQPPVDELLDPSVIYQSGLAGDGAMNDGGLMDPSISYQSGLGEVGIDPMADDGIVTTDNVNTNDGNVDGSLDGVDPIIYQTSGGGIQTFGGPRNTDGIQPNQRNLTAKNNRAHKHGAWNGMHANAAKGAGRRNVNNAAKTPIVANGGKSFNAVLNQAFTKNIGTFHAQTVDVIFNAKIKWGDGTKSIGTLTGGIAAGGDFQVFGTHKYANTGVYQVKIQVTSAIKGNHRVSHPFATVKSIATVTALT